jgi:hypothetical protein
MVQPFPDFCRFPRIYAFCFSKSLLILVLGWKYIREMSSHSQLVVLAEVELCSLQSFLGANLECQQIQQSKFSLLAQGI